MSPIRSFLLLVVATATPVLDAAGLGMRRLPIVMAQTVPKASDPSDNDPSDALRAADRAFVLQGLETSRAQAELARLAVSQATRSDLREFAQQLAEDYREINITLESLARRKAVTPPIQPASFSERYRALAAQPGPGFDQAYIREMAAANERALRIVEAAIGTVKDTDLRDFAGGLLPVLREHFNRGSELAKTL